MIFDLDVGGIQAALNRDLRVLLGGSGAIALLLIAVIAAVVRIVLLRRLQRFETTASLIAKGDLGKRVPAEGADTIYWLAREFNTMADSMTGLLHQVNNQQRRLETIINSIDDGIVVLDPRRKVIAANDAFLSRLGHSREETVGCSCGNLTSGLCTSTDCPQGQGCAPGILGVAIGGDRGSSYVKSKEVLFDQLGERNPDPELSALEERLTEEANTMGIGPMGFGGKTTVIDTKSPD